MDVCQTTTPKSPNCCNGSLIAIAHNLATTNQILVNAIVAIVSMQTATPTAPPSGPTWTLRGLIRSAKDYAEGVELLRKLWAWRQPAFLIASIYGWWDYLVALLRWAVW